MTRSRTSSRGNGDVADHLRERGEDRAGGGRARRGRVPDRRSILIENPVALVDKNADEHCVRTWPRRSSTSSTRRRPRTCTRASAFLRPTDPRRPPDGRSANGFPAIKDLFTVDDFGGWDALNEKLFSDTGIATTAIAGQADPSDGQRRADVRRAVGRPGGPPPRSAARLRHLGPARRRPRLPRAAGRPAGRRRSSRRVSATGSDVPRSALAVAGRDGGDPAHPVHVGADGGASTRSSARCSRTSSCGSGSRDAGCSRRSSTCRSRSRRS